MQTERIKLYQEFIELVMESMRMGRQLKPNAKKTQILGEGLQTLGFRMMVISTDDVIHGYLVWRAIAMEGSDPERVFNAFADLIIYMRRESMSGDDALTRENVLDILT